MNNFERLVNTLKMVKRAFEESPNDGFDFDGYKNEINKALALGEGEK